MRYVSLRFHDIFVLHFNLKVSNLYMSHLIRLQTRYSRKWYFIRYNRILFQCLHRRFSWINCRTMKGKFMLILHSLSTYSYFQSKNSIEYIFPYRVSYIPYLCRVFSFLHLLNVSPWGHVWRRGGKRSVLPVGKYSQYIFVHIRRLKKKKKKEGNMWKKGRGRRTYTLFPSSS